MDLDLLNRHLPKPLDAFEVFDISAPEDVRKKMELNSVSTDSPLSISHTVGLGGYAISGQSNAVGVDIEVVDRLEKPVVARISSEEEMSLFGENWAHIWPLKEAVFKATSKEFDLTVISQVRLGEFQPLSDQIHQCNNISANGLLLQGVTALSWIEGRFIFGIITR